MFKDCDQAVIKLIKNCVLTTHLYTAVLINTFGMFKTRQFVRRFSTRMHGFIRLSFREFLGVTYDFSTLSTAPINTITNLNNLLLLNNFGGCEQ